VGRVRFDAGGPLLLYIFAAVAAVGFILERLVPARPQPILRRGLVTDGLYVVVNVILRIAFTGSIAMVIEDASRSLLPDWAIAVLRDDPLWVQAIAVVVVLDFFFYWMHRAKHRYDWWWRLHETHHSSRDLDWFSSVRFHPLEKILDRAIYLAPLLFLGVSDQALLILAGLDAAVATISHANVRLRIGPLIYLFVGPEMHRLHHARASTAQRCNFGNNLSIFDWLFGTAVLREVLPEEFGLDDEGYPEGNMVRQFFYAFRPFPAEPRVDSNATIPA
jgi:sterol desaturase/sphingolipid hydroxylase (fatty acid hydroxylase superfamily)